MALELFKFSPLPNPPEKYDPLFFRQFLRTLELYFSQLDALTPNQAKSYRADNFYGSGTGIIVPTGQFTSSATQTAASTTVAYAVQFDASTLLNAVSLVSSTRITFAQAGIYRLSYALQFHNPTNSTETVNVWVRKNGTNIALSNHKHSIPARKSAGVPAHLLGEGSLLVQVAASDYVEIMWNVSDITVILEQSAASGSPSIPATPSADVSVDFVSAAAS
jgi:hypothetical protein